MKKIIYISLIIASYFLTQGCESVLDIDNKSAINPGDVWNDANMANAYLTNLYGAIMPGLSQNSGKGSDEAGTIYEGMNGFLSGTATIDSWDNWPYTTIRTINFLFENIDNGTISDDDKNLIKGQAYFFRAWLYWGMVKGYGGVPLVLKPQDKNKDDLFVYRSKTSDCIKQIISDLDEAYKMLPPVWTKQVNRIDQCAALAVKGEVLLWWASPLFNPNDDQQRWTDAYNACKAAKDLAEANGKALYRPYSKIWDDEMNSEVVMVRRFQYPGASYDQNGLRPLLYSQDNHDFDRPSLELVNAFPMKDGSKWTGTDYKSLHKNRDDRFYATIAYNGSAPYLKELIDGKWNMWTYRAKGGIWAADVKDGSLYSSTGFYRAKGMDKTITQSTKDQCGLDNIIIRFAEVLMNFGEAANGANRPDEALQVLYTIRDRAGIDKGADNKYGITATTRADISRAYLDERQVEFAFEGKRWNDLRRLRQFDILRTLAYRHGLSIFLKPEFDTDADYKTNPPIPRDANLDDVVDKFNYTVIRSAINTELELTMQPKDQYYFYAIPKTHLEKNANLEQTKGWDNGTFDPLL